jgi:hypothetical protein
MTSLNLNEPLMDDRKRGTIEWGGHSFDINDVLFKSGKINIRANKYFEHLDPGVLTGDIVVRGVDGGVVLRSPMGPVSYDEVVLGYMNIDLPIDVMWT